MYGGTNAGSLDRLGWMLVTHGDAMIVFVLCFVAFLKLKKLRKQRGDARGIRTDRYGRRVEGVEWVDIIFDILPAYVIMGMILASIGIYLLGEVFEMVPANIGYLAWVWHSSLALMGG
jgi:hypothetical protein